MEKDRDYIFPHKIWGDRFNPPLPTVFDDALSYSQQMSVLYKTVCETLEWMKQHKSDVLADARLQTEKMLNEYDKQFDAKFDAVYAKIKSVKQHLENEISLTNSTVENNHRYSQHQISNLNKSMAQLNTQLSDLTQSYRSLTDGNEKFKRFIQKILDDFIDAYAKILEENLASANGDRLIVYNPVTGNSTVLKQALNDIYGYRAEYGITVSELGRLAFTVKGIADLQFTVKTWRERAGIILYQLTPDVRQEISLNTQMRMKLNAGVPMTVQSSVQENVAYRLEALPTSLGLHEYHFIFEKVLLHPGTVFLKMEMTPYKENMEGAWGELVAYAGGINGHAVCRNGTMNITLPDFPETGVFDITVAYVATIEDFPNAPFTGTVSKATSYWQEVKV